MHNHRLWHRNRPTTRDTPHALHIARVTANALALALLALAIAACAATQRGLETRQVAAPEYAPAFRAALDTLRNRGFELARVDARAGTIETMPRTSAGALTPWIRHSVNAAQGIRGMLHHERRTARVFFAPADVAAGTAARPPESTPDDQPTPEDTLADLREWDGPVSIRVVVEVQRLNRPGTEASPTSITFDSTTLGRSRGEPELTARPELVPAGQDTELARVLAAEIARAAAGK